MSNEFPPLIYGGLGTAVGGLVNATLHYGIDVAVLLVRDTGHIGYSHSLKEVDHKEAEISYRNTFPNIFLFSWHDDIKKLIQLIQKWRPDVLHLHSFWLFHIARAIKEYTGIPIVYTVHSLDRAEYEIGLAPSFVLSQSATQEAAISIADRVIVLSQSERDLLVSYYPEAKDRTRIVGNGIDDCCIEDYRFVTKNSENESPIVLYAGRFVDRKGIRDLLAAIPAVLHLSPSTQFVLVGGQPGSSAKDMEGWWLPEFLYPYRNQIKFTGWIPTSEVNYWYTKADILVVPSWYEPFGMVILEGMLYGLAILATNTGGPLEILEHGRTGLLFPPKDIKALSNFIALLANDRNLRHQIAAAAAKEVRGKWSWNKIFEKMLNVYYEVAH
jgi:glycogen synthase